MKGAVKLISIRGITLFLHWSFLLLLAIIILMNNSIGNTVDRLSWSLLFVAAILFCIVLHELGHALIALSFGIKAHNILLLPIGGVASIEKFPSNPKQEVFISASGPLVNISIALVLYFLVLRHQNIPDFSFTSFSLSLNFLYNLFLANIALAAFNLIPAFPMDGGRILRALLGFRINHISATNITGIIGKIIAIVFIGLGIILVNFSLPLIGLFIIFSADTEKYYLHIQSMIKGIKIKEVAIQGYFGLSANLTVKEAAGILMNNFNKYFILTENARPIASLKRMDIISALAEKKYDSILKSLTQHEIISFNGNDDVESILDILANHETLNYPVTIDGVIIGVVNFNQVIEYVLLNNTGSENFEKVKSLAKLVSY